MDAYTLMKNKNTKELHLFKGKILPSGCNAENFSICNQMIRSQSEGNVFECFTEDEARITCAQLGREVCGNCVSSLYANNY